MTALQARQQAVKRLSDLYHAEWNGLMRAEYTAASMPFSSDPEMQAAFERGLREGREILAVQ